MSLTYGCRTYLTCNRDRCRGTDSEEGRFPRWPDTDAQPREWVKVANNQDKMLNEAISLWYFHSLPCVSSELLIRGSVDDQTLLARTNSPQRIFRPLAEGS